MVVAPRVAASLGPAGIDAQRRLREVVRRSLASWRAGAAAAAASESTEESLPTSEVRPTVAAAQSAEANGTR